jgi:hypothetical protein
MNINNSVLWDITPCTPLDVSQSFGETCRLHIQGRRVIQVRNQHEPGIKKSSARSQTLKMEVICSLETPVDFHHTTGRYITEDPTNHEFLLSLNDSADCGELESGKSGEVIWHDV